MEPCLHILPLDYPPNEGEYPCGELATSTLLSLVILLFLF